MDPIQIRDIELLVLNLSSLTSFKPHARPEATKETFDRLQSHLEEMSSIQIQLESFKSLHSRTTTETLVRKQEELLNLSQELVEITSKTAAMKSVSDDFTAAKAFRQSQLMFFFQATAFSILILMLFRG